MQMSLFCFNVADICGCRLHTTFTKNRIFGPCAISAINQELFVVEYKYTETMSTTLADILLCKVKFSGSLFVICKFYNNFMDSDFFSGNPGNMISVFCVCFYNQLKKE